MLPLSHPVHENRRSFRNGGFPAAASLLAPLLASSLAFAAEPKKVTYEDDVLPIFRDNCLKCHNPDCHSSCGSKSDHF